MIFIVVREHIHPVNKSRHVTAIETIYNEEPAAALAAERLATTFKCRTFVLQFPDLPMLTVPNVIPLDKFKTVQ